MLPIVKNCKVLVIGWESRLSGKIFKVLRQVNDSEVHLGKWVLDLKPEDYGFNAEFVVAESRYLRRIVGDEESQTESESSILGCGLQAGLSRLH